MPTANAVASPWSHSSEIADVANAWRKALATPIKNPVTFEYHTNNITRHNPKLLTVPGNCHNHKPNHHHHHHLIFNVVSTADEELKYCNLLRLIPYVKPCSQCHQTDSILASRVLPLLYYTVTWRFDFIVIARWSRLAKFSYTSAKLILGWIIAFK